MRIDVRLFARARELTASDRLSVELAEGATVAELRQALGRQAPALAPLVPRLLVAIGTRYARDEDRIAPTDDVACFPPVSGG